MNSLYYYLALFSIFLIILSLFKIISVEKPSVKNNEIIISSNRKIYNSMGNIYKPCYYPYKNTK
jgi:hypothetical protein